jgi:Tfp pilus assembly protein PilW
MSGARGRERGMSIPEVMTATVVVAFVTAVAYKVFLRFSYQSRAQAAIAKAQSELIPIQTALEKNLRRAMYNMPAACAGYNASMRVDTLKSLEVKENGSGPDEITVRGNFTEAATQLTQPLPRSVTQMQVRTGGTAGFKTGDTLLLRDAQNAEWCIVTGVNTSANRITTRTRRIDFQVGAEVVRIGGVTFRPRGDTLYQVTGGRKHILSRNLYELEFTAQGHDGKWDATPPFAPDQVQALQYAIKTRVQKPGKKGWLYREATGLIALRNAQ